MENDERKMSEWHAWVQEYAENKKKEVRQELLVSLVKDGLLKSGDAAKRLNMTEDEFKKLI